MMYLRYLWYVLRHKFFVAVACFKDGLYWQGLAHDWHKFLPREFVPYAHHFYGGGHTITSRRDKTGYWKPGETGDPKFDLAWFYHQKLGKHHWQFWVSPADAEKPKWFVQAYHDLGPDFLAIDNKKIAMFADWDSEKRFDDPEFGVRQEDRDNSLLVKKRLNRPDIFVYPIPEKYIREMVCDWIGASKAQRSKTDHLGWWEANNYKLILHPNTRARIEEILNEPMG